MTRALVEIILIDLVTLSFDAKAVRQSPITLLRD